MTPFLRLVQAAERAEDVKWYRAFRLQRPLFEAVAAGIRQSALAQAALRRARTAYRGEI